ncbi:hypothetical protein MPC4_10295 [Methylocella tundrae]|uniref:Uncharacterized protein n=1 Tax=Methylocella tundrae TaxID=227605 RepID=A0A8B6M0W1_METTU|nr:hypothetical protein MPC1_2990004 [Methylocella tundrae]VTZ48345.1 hypothetical protein MPC4_10295 [Methylocella tundrae]
MYMSAAACLICAIILSRHFKFYVLIPASFLIVVTVCLKDGYFGQSLSRVALEAIILLTSLQVGYVCGLLFPLIPAIVGTALKASFGGVPAQSLSFHAPWLRRRRTGTPPRSARFGDLPPDAARAHETGRPAA